MNADNTQFHNELQSILDNIKVAELRIDESIKTINEISAIEKNLNENLDFLNNNYKNLKEESSSAYKEVANKLSKSTKETSCKIREFIKNATNYRSIDWML